MYCRIRYRDSRLIADDASEVRKQIRRPLRPLPESLRNQQGHGCTSKSGAPVKTGPGAPSFKLMLSDCGPMSQRQRERGRQWEVREAKAAKVMVARERMLLAMGTASARSCV